MMVNVTVIFQEAKRYFRVRRKNPSVINSIPPCSGTREQLKAAVYESARFAKVGKAATEDYRVIIGNINKHQSCHKEGFAFAASCSASIKGFKGFVQ
jgi:hypothetical protein